MLEKLKSGFSNAKNSLFHEMTLIGQSTMKGGTRLINSWLDVLPIMEEQGLEIVSFAMGYSLSPCLEVELKGDCDEFTEERLDKIMDENPGAIAKTIFQAIKTTLNIYRKTDSTPQNELIVAIRVRLSPEVKVFVGAPITQ